MTCDVGRANIQFFDKDQEALRQRSGASIRSKIAGESIVPGRQSMIRSPLSGFLTICRLLLFTQISYEAKKGRGICPKATAAIVITVPTKSTQGNAKRMCAPMFTLVNAIIK